MGTELEQVKKEINTAEKYGLKEFEIVQEFRDREKLVFWIEEHKEEVESLGWQVTIVRERRLDGRTIAKFRKV